MKPYKIVLTADENFESDFSIEAGKHDGQNHFDHHGEFKHEKPVCLQHIVALNERICKKCKKFSFAIREVQGGTCEFEGFECGHVPVIQITHMDLDTYIALLRLLHQNALPGWGVSEKDFERSEVFFRDAAALDEGKKLPSDNPARLFSAGLREFVKIPRCTKEHQDVTELIPLNLSYGQVIKKGEEVADKNFHCFYEAMKKYAPLKTLKGSGLLFKVTSENTNGFSPLYAYYDMQNSQIGMQNSQISMQVIYREKYKTVSVSLHPERDLTLSQMGHHEESDGSAYQTTIAGINFYGHEKVAGTERGINYTFEDAERVYNELCSISDVC